MCKRDMGSKQFAAQRREEGAHCNGVPELVEQLVELVHVVAAVQGLGTKVLHKAYFILCNLHESNAFS